ncbi:hypothetical protein BV20DRAFT_965389 [Pilatotrama ljubarskyi]|nr:hypothetical protein BV20DRAFT_965389 [Pilatotrama ljubarskyi]
MRRAPPDDAPALGNLRPWGLRAGDPWHGPHGAGRTAPVEPSGKARRCPPSTASAASSPPPTSSSPATLQASGLLRPLSTAMKFSAAALSATLAALVGSTVAQLQIISPGGPDLWWVAQSDNVLSWTCKTSPYTNFTVLIANSNPAVLTSPQALIAQQNNFDCSKLVTKDQFSQSAATGYTIQLADPFNSTHIYAESQPFEIKPLGSTYPASSATPTLGGSATASGSGSATASGSAASGSATAQSDNKNGAGSLAASGGLVAVAVAALGFMFA